MVKVEFLGPIKKESVELDIHSIDELSEYMLSHSDLKKWVANSAIAVNDTIVTDKEYQLKSGDTVSVLPPVCGG